MKHLFICFSVLMSLLIISSCSDDDNEGGGISGGKLVGTWSTDITTAIGSSSNNGDCTYYQFQKDGTLVIVEKSGRDLEISFGSYKASGNKLVVLLNNEEDVAEYKISDNKLYLSLPVAGILTTFVFTRVDDNVMELYFTSHNLKDYLKQYEVNLNQYQVNLDQYKVNLDQSQVSIDQYKINLTPNATIPGLSCPDSKHPHAIDMGGAGKWACCNVGASNPTEFGGYYAWGETEEKDYYSWSTYKYCNGSYETCQNLGSDISGTSYDVAHVKWGGKWKMPSLERIRSLMNTCTSEWYQHNLYGETNIENCYLINGKTYRIPNVDGLYLINDKVYKLSSLENYYLINGKIYRMNNVENYYLINDKVYKLEKLYNYYVINDKMYLMDDTNDYYINGNTLYVIPDGIVTGLDGLSAMKASTSANSLYNSSLSQIAVSLGNKKVHNTVSGRIFTSNNGHSIFLPAAGYRWYHDKGNVGTRGDYWSATPTPGYPYNAYNLSFDSGSTYVYRYYYDRDYGLSVRPVTE